MRWRWLLAFPVFALVGFVAATTASGGMYNRVLEIGAPAPDWQQIIGTDDQLHSLADYKDAKAVVIVFTCNHCPVALACEQRLIDLQKDYADKGVQVVAINVNNSPEDTLEPMKVHAADRKFNFPYLYDSTQKVGKDYGAAVTPHVFLLDGQRKVAYMGLIDDSPLNEAEVTKTFLRDALDSVLAGKTPSVTETRQKGCAIQYQR